MPTLQRAVAGADRGLEAVGGKSRVRSAPLAACGMEGGCAELDMLISQAVEGVGCRQSVMSWSRGCEVCWEGGIGSCQPAGPAWVLAREGACQALHKQASRALEVERAGHALEGGSQGCRTGPVQLCAGLCSRARAQGSEALDDD